MAEKGTRKDDPPRKDADKPVPLDEQVLKEVQELCKFVGYITGGQYVIKVEETDIGKFTSVEGKGDEYIEHPVDNGEIIPSSELHLESRATVNKLYYDVRAHLFVRKKGDITVVYLSSPDEAGISPKDAKNTKTLKNKTIERIKRDGELVVVQLIVYAIKKILWGS